MTRKIDLKTTYAGPDGVMHPGVQIVAKNVAKGLVESNQAEYADGLPPEVAVIAAPQVAAIKPPEKAVAQPQKAVPKPAVQVESGSPWGTGGAK